MRASEVCLTVWSLGIRGLGFRAVLLHYISMTLYHSTTLHYTAALHCITLLYTSSYYNAGLHLEEDVRQRRPAQLQDLLLVIARIAQRPKSPKGLGSSIVDTSKAKHLLHW